MERRQNERLLALARPMDLESRLSYYRMILPGAAAAVALPLGLDRIEPYLIAFDRTLLPLMVAIFLSLLLLTWTRLKVEWLEWLILGAMAGFVLGRLLYLLAAPGVASPAAALGATLPWVIITMLLNAGLLSPRRGVQANVALLGVLATGLTLWWPGDRPSPERQHLISALSQLLLAAGSVLMAQVVISQRSAAFSRRARRALREANLDALTGLPNRRALDGQLERLSREAGGLLAVALIDVDHFKAINDRYGHARGDEVLRAVGAGLRGCMAPGQILGRYGGEEFLCMSEVPDVEAARRWFELVRRRVPQITVDGLDGLKVTVSVGLVVSPLPRLPAEVLEAADAALYRAKAAGRDNVQLDLLGLDDTPPAAAPEWRLPTPVQS
ncbi:GGDEF domain-containing protein [Deinococcus koreensis]|uniref:GGDEF domain-containing protein n=1 Tax=Deinococcus koreensis TaxID=2054903 RepID=A0A2K3V006_9DEIO|nr:GGDEF domain-containing protein [Deinococcus koreensis]PNY82128.1 hypothetical protein CVO96_12780 [Deinococcus koreensis]